MQLWNGGRPFDQADGAIRRQRVPPGGRRPLTRVGARETRRPPVATTGALDLAASSILRRKSNGKGTGTAAMTPLNIAPCLRNS